MQAQSEPRRLRAARVIVMEGWRETMRMDSEYRILRDVEYPPTPSICVKVFERETLGLDLAHAGLGFRSGHVLGEPGDGGPPR